MAVKIGVMVGGVTVWTMATFSCGMSQTYWQLMGARMFVGAGESSLTPAAWSMLADYFPPDKLALPTSIYLMGPYLGGGLAQIGGAEVPRPRCPARRQKRRPRLRRCAADR